ncbi:MAG: hypothetical protein JXR46_03770 [Calditrichaceae bacterium]|nr:hypothetical protein [Calditrichaceae bacterium]MBN2708143.1 hypothetical protein [Calditrichaceae bacterium]
MNLGKIDDANDTYLNGLNVGSMDFFPPSYTSTWDIYRYYKVPHKIINYGGKNSIVVRVFERIIGGDFYNESEKVIKVSFESTYSNRGGSYN